MVVVGGERRPGRWGRGRGSGRRGSAGHRALDGATRADRALEDLVGGRVDERIGVDHRGRRPDDGNAGLGELRPHRADEGGDAGTVARVRGLPQQHFTRGVLNVSAIKAASLQHRSEGGGPAAHETVVGHIGVRPQDHRSQLGDIAGDARLADPEHTCPRRGFVGAGLQERDHGGGITRTVVTGAAAEPWRVGGEAPRRCRWRRDVGPICADGWRSSTNPAHRRRRPPDPLLSTRHGTQPTPGDQGRLSLRRRDGSLLGVPSVVQARRRRPRSGRRAWTTDGPGHRTAPTRGETHSSRRLRNNPDPRCSTGTTWSDTRRALRSHTAVNEALGPRCGSEVSPVEPT